MNSDEYLNLFHLWLVAHAHLTSLISAELGDFDPAVHTAAFVSEFRFVPAQTEDMEVEILNIYRHLR